MALQFGPHLVLLPLPGSVADRFDRRRCRVVTRSIMFVLALVPGLLLVRQRQRHLRLRVASRRAGCASSSIRPDEVA